MYILSVINRVHLAHGLERRLRKVPRHVVLKLLGWVEAVEHDGLENVRRIPGYHDEPLKGDRHGQRSIRLSKGWRAIYAVFEDGSVQFVQVEEVNHHDY